VVWSSLQASGSKFTAFVIASSHNSHLAGNSLLAIIRWNLPETSFETDKRGSDKTRRQTLM